MGAAEPAHVERGAVDADLAGRLRDVDPAVLGQRIRNARLSRGLTQAALAADAVTVGYVSRIEGGQRRPDASLLERFATSLGTTAEHLITGVEPARADEIALTLLHAELALETGAAAEALAALASLTSDPDLPADVRARAGFLRARGLEAVGQYDEAIIEMEHLVENPTPASSLLPVWLALSRCHRESGDLNRAIEVGERALRALNEAGLDGGDEAVRLTVTVAAAYFERGDVGHAVRVAKNAVGRAEALGSADARAAAYWEASVFESRRGGAAAAIPYAVRALALLASGEDRRNLARLRAQLGVMLLRVDPPEVADALVQLEHAREELSASSASVVDIAHVDVALARASLLRGDCRDATDRAQSALAMTRDRAPAVAADAASVLGAVALRLDDSERAAECYRDAVALLTAVGQDRQAAQLWLELGSQLELVGDVDAARDAYRRAAVASGLRLPAASALIG